MPTELRHLLFRPAEVIEAVCAYQRRVGEAMPEGPVLYSTLEPDDDDGGVRLCITIATAAGRPGKGRKSRAPSREEVIVGDHALAAALILYCRDLRIPLPARAEKSLQLFGDQLGLIVSFKPKGAGQR